MDPQTFDRFARLLSMPRSRRTTWRALLGAALLGATTRTAVAAATDPCAAGAEDYCVVGDARVCCPGRCFVKCGGGEEICCTKPNWVMCGNSCCPYDPTARNPCEHCPPGLSGGGDACVGVITGTYRRR